jgi:hypothetical protein
MLRLRTANCEPRLFVKVALSRLTARQTADSGLAGFDVLLQSLLKIQPGEP